MRMNHLLFQVLTRPPAEHRASVRAAQLERQRETSTKEPERAAADRQTDVRADGQMRALRLLSTG